MALSTVRPSWTPPFHGNLDMSWEELTRLSDRELLLLLHQRVDQLEQKVDPVVKWHTMAVGQLALLRWAWTGVIALLGLAIASHAAHWW